MELEHVDLGGNPVQRMPLAIERLQTKVESTEVQQSQDVTLPSVTRTSIVLPRLPLVSMQLLVG